MSNQDISFADPKSYLRQLSWALQHLPAEDRQAIVDEIASHLEIYEAADEEQFTAAIKRLGSPYALAEGYLENYAFAGALSRRSPLRLLTLSLNSGFGTATYVFSTMIACLCYLFTAALALIALTKPLFPAHVGYQTDAAGQFLGAGILSLPPVGAQEHLGYLIIPIAAAAAIIFYFVGNSLLRQSARHRLLRRRPL